MGCGNVFKKEVVSTKDVDLTFEPKKPQFKDTSDSFFLIKERLIFPVLLFSVISFAIVLSKSIFFIP